MGGALSHAANLIVICAYAILVLLHKSIRFHDPAFGRTHRLPNHNLFLVICSQNSVVRERNGYD